MSVTIIGAGLSGLAIAYRLQCAGTQVQVLEANAVPGGRIQPAVLNGHQDLGPTWIWPYAQPVIAQWLDELGLTLFDQFDTGSGLVDHASNATAKPQNLPSQYGIARIEGGTHALIEALHNKLENPVKFEHVVSNCVRINDQWQLSVKTPNDALTPTKVMTDQLIIAIPPRLSAALVTTDDVELRNALDVLQTTETWMAQHAKIVVLYDSPFWRDEGLSGRVMSQVGPLVEIHDHSGPAGTPAALFGFSGVPAQVRHASSVQFIEAIKQQLTRCFGETAPEPTNIIVKDWAFEPYTTTDADRLGDGAHPQVLAQRVRDAHCARSLWFGVSETSTRSPGLIEGALARADQLSSDILSAR